VIPQLFYQPVQYFKDIFFYTNECVQFEVDKYIFWTEHAQGAPSINEGGTLYSEYRDKKELICRKTD